MKIADFVRSLHLLSRTVYASDSTPRASCLQYQIKDGKLIETFNQSTVTASPISNRTDYGLRLTSFVWCPFEEPLPASDVKCNCHYPEDVARFETTQPIPDPGILFRFDNVKHSYPSYELRWAGADQKYPVRVRWLVGVQTRKDPDSFRAIWEIEIDAGKDMWKFTPGYEFAEFPNRLAPDLPLQYAVARAATELNWWEVSQPDHPDFESDLSKNYRQISQAWMIRGGHEKAHYDIKALQWQSLDTRGERRIKEVNQNWRVGLGLGIPVAVLVGWLLTWLWMRRKHHTTHLSTPTGSSTAPVVHRRASHTARPAIHISKQGAIFSAPVATGGSSGGGSQSAPTTLNRRSSSAASGVPPVPQQYSDIPSYRQSPMRTPSTGGGNTQFPFVTTDETLGTEDARRHSHDAGQDTASRATHRTGSGASNRRSSSASMRRISPGVAGTPPLPRTATGTPGATATFQSRDSDDDSGVGTPLSPSNTVQQQQQQQQQQEQQKHQGEQSQEANLLGHHGQATPTITHHHSLPKVFGPSEREVERTSGRVPRSSSEFYFTQRGAASASALSGHHHGGGCGSISSTTMMSGGASGYDLDTPAPGSSSSSSSCGGTHDHISTQLRPATAGPSPGWSNYGAAAPGTRRASIDEVVYDARSRSPVGGGGVGGASGVGGAAQRRGSKYYSSVPTSGYS